MNFNIVNVIFSMPEIIVLAGACLLILLDLVLYKNQKGIIGYLSLLIILIAGAGTLILSSPSVEIFDRMFVVDGYSTFFKMIFYLSTFLAVLLSINYIKIEGVEYGEYYILMLFAMSGMMVMASSIDLLSIYVGLELMALSIYILTGFKQYNGCSNEAAMKYVILGAFSSGILLYGISLVYGLTGTTQLADIAGIPPTAGFIGKFYIFMSLIKTGYVSLAIIAVIMSVISAYFYIRIVMLIYMKEPVREFDLARSPANSLALIIAVIGTIIIGILPAWFLEMAKSAIFPG